MLFQLMFAIITPALITGTFAERMKFSTFIVFTLLWATLVYDPLAHWVWGKGGWLGSMGTLDFAGGTVVHISSGISALAAALVIGRRRALVTSPCAAQSSAPSRGQHCCGSDGSGSMRAVHYRLAPWRSAFTVTNTAAAQPPFHGCLASGPSAASRRY
jgi:ammonia channel protein AmtB